MPYFKFDDELWWTPPSGIFNIKCPQMVDRDRTNPVSRDKMIGRENWNLVNPSHTLIDVCKGSRIFILFYLYNPDFSFQR